MKINSKDKRTLLTLTIRYSKSCTCPKCGCSCATTCDQCGLCSKCCQCSEK